MSFEDDFLELMPDTITCKAATGVNLHGERTYGTGTKVRARVVYVQRIVRQIDGQELESLVTVYCAGAPGVGENDLIELPNGHALPVSRVRRYGDEAGVHHEELLLGWRERR